MGRKRTLSFSCRDGRLDLDDRDDDEVRDDIVAACAAPGSGGGGGGSQFSSPPYHAYNGADGGHGAVRIIWGAGREFPNTNTGDI